MCVHMSFHWNASNYNYQKVCHKLLKPTSKFQYILFYKCENLNIVASCSLNLKISTIFGILLNTLGSCVKAFYWAWITYITKRGLHMCCWYMCQWEAWISWSCLQFQIHLFIQISSAPNVAIFVLRFDSLYFCHCAHTKQTKGAVVWAKLFQKWAIIIACTQEECS